MGVQFEYIHFSGEVVNKYKKNYIGLKNWRMKFLRKLVLEIYLVILGMGKKIY